MIDLTGQRFGRWTALEQSGKTKHGSYLWKCRCDCGNIGIVSSGNLRSGISKSCGCYEREKASKTHKKHGMAKSRLYSIWLNMRDRCYREKNNHYHVYGEKGISVCPEWLGEHGFDNFSKWSMANGYKDNLTLDRIDNDKGYSPGNCRWATQKEQQNHRTNNHYVEINGVTKSLMEWCESGIYEANYPTVKQRIRMGWDDISAITKPVNKKFRSRRCKC